MKKFIKNWIIVMLALAISACLAGCSIDIINNEKYSVEILKTDGGKITASSSFNTAGTRVTLNITPEEDNVLKDLIIEQTNGTSVKSSISLARTAASFSMPHSNVTVTGNFEWIDPDFVFYTVTIEKTPNGTVTADLKRCTAGETVKITITPDQNCILRKLTIKDNNGNDVSFISEGLNTAYLIMPEHDITVEGFFEKIDPAAKCNISIDSSIENGTITLIGPETRTPGETVFLTISPDSGYLLKDITVLCAEDLKNDLATKMLVIITNNTAEFIMHVHDIIVYADFVYIQKISEPVVQTGEGVLETSTKSCIAGTTVTIDIYPGTNEKLSSLNAEDADGKPVDLDGYGFTRTFIMPDSEVKITGNFEKRYTTIPDGDMTIHFLELGNKYTGDSVYINYGDLDIIIDAGSKQDSAATIIKYLNDNPDYVKDGKLEYVIATHAHEDHIGAFNAMPQGITTKPGVLTSFKIETIIDFTKTNSTTATYNRYINTRTDLVKNGTVHYNALQCFNGEYGAERIFDLGGGLKMEILYNYYYDHYSSNENMYSVCVKFIHDADGEKYQYIFTGDLEEDGENRMVDYYAGSGGLGHCKLYKGGHHGSRTSSHVKLMADVSPEYVCVCSCTGSTEYNAAAQNIFPSQDFINRVAPYTDKVYITSYVPNFDAGIVSPLNGNIIFRITRRDTMEFLIECSNNDLKLKETEWFIKNRTVPEKWK